MTFTLTRVVHSFLKWPLLVCLGSVPYGLSEMRIVNTSARTVLFVMDLFLLRGIWKYSTTHTILAYQYPVFVRLFPRHSLWTWSSSLVNVWLSFLSFSLSDLRPFLSVCLDLGWMWDIGISNDTWMVFVDYYWGARYIHWHHILYYRMSMDTSPILGTFNPRNRVPG